MCMLLGGWTRYELGWVVVAALGLWVRLARAEEPDVQRVRQTGARFVLVHHGQTSCRILNTVTEDHSGIVGTAIGQLNEYLAANHGARPPVESSASLPRDGDWIVTAVGAEPPGVLDLVEDAGNIGDQGFLVRQVTAPDGNGRWLIVWGKHRSDAAMV